MLKLCLVFWKSEPHYAYKRYAYKGKNVFGAKYFVRFRQMSALEHVRFEQFLLYTRIT